MKKVTILIPCYNEAQSLPHLYCALENLMNVCCEYEWEILMIDDGSTDTTLTVMKDLRKSDHRICYVSLSRNFGKENAMLAGFDYATGDSLVIIDADLQHPPLVIASMLEKWEEGYQDVYGKRITRGNEPLLRKLLTSFFYKLIQKSVEYNILQNVGDFRLLDRKCIEALKELRESERYTTGMFAWIGFKKTYVEFETKERIAGNSHMSYKKLLKLAFNGISSFTVAPLRWSAYLGFLVSLIAFIYSVFVFMKTIILGEVVQGYPTLVILILFFSGLQLIILGVIGAYLGKIFTESKKRPVYIVNEYEK